MLGSRPIPYPLNATTAADAVKELALCVADAAVFIPTNKPAQVGTRLHARVTLRDGDTFLDLTGKVAWVFPKDAPLVGRRAGMGVLVENATEDTYARMQDVRTHSAGLQTDADGAGRHAQMPGRAFWGFAVDAALEMRFDAIDSWRRVRDPAVERQVQPSVPPAPANPSLPPLEVTAKSVIRPPMEVAPFSEDSVIDDAVSEVPSHEGPSAVPKSTMVRPKLAADGPAPQPATAAAQRSFATFDDDDDSEVTQPLELPPTRTPEADQKASLATLAAASPMDLAAAVADIPSDEAAFAAPPIADLAGPLDDAVNAGPHPADDAADGPTTEVDDTLQQQLVDELDTEGVPSLDSGEFVFAENGGETTTGEDATSEGNGVPSIVDVSSFAHSSDEESAPLHTARHAAADDDDVFDEVTRETDGDSLAPALETLHADPHEALTAIAFRPVVNRKFPPTTVPTNPAFSTTPPPTRPSLTAVYATRSKRFEQDGGDGIGDVSPFGWPPSGTQRPIANAVFLDAKDASVEGDAVYTPAPQGVIAAPLPISASFASDDFATEVTDPTPVLTSDDPVPTPLPQTLMPSPFSPAPGTDDSAPPEALPAAVKLGINDAAPSPVVEEGASLPADISLPITATMSPMKLCVFEGETLLGHLMWSAAPESTAEVTVHVDATGFVMLGVVDPTGSGTSKRFNTSFAR